MKKKEILSCRNLCVGRHYGLNHFQMEVYQSEGVLVLGNCASGKEILRELLVGQRIQYEGTFYWMEESITPKKLREIIKQHAIFYVNPDKVLIENCSIAENIYVIRTRKGKGIVMPSAKAIHIQTANLLREFEISLNPQMLVKELTYFERLLVCLIKAKSYDSKVVILEHSDDNLQPGDLAVLKKILLRLKEQGTSFIFLAEKYDNVREMCDRVILMSDGRDKKTSTTDSIIKEEIPYYWLGEAYRKNRFSAAGAVKADVWIEKEDVHDMRRKNVMGIFDKDWGSREGTPEDLKKLFLENCEVMQPYKAFTENLFATEKFKRKQYLYVENREYDKLLGDISLANNLMLCRDLREFFGMIHKSREMILEKEFYKQFPFLVARGRQYSDHFFYRLVAIYRLERFHQKLMILDNPFVRLDVAEENYMREYLLHLAQWKKLILISHRLHEIDCIAGTVLYVEDGRIVQIETVV
ncbi:hypothetical protein [Parablautia sp. Marseille-Q6255]|uniref:hypothetical protein n=1 Tax=Parablautia sp. Marseille-Q6255 TaxID=3039593 RepID=UPI0024BC6232|nr:hypothetical protein [Parablautia sp. Marseille-Q6255]